jgi:hypothetical protein
MTRDDLVRRLKSQIGDDVREIYSHEALFKAAADRIEADGKLIAEMREVMAEAKQLRARIIHTEFQLRAAQAFDRKLDALLARLDAEAQR